MNISSALLVWLSEAPHGHIHSGVTFRKSRDYLSRISRRYCEFHEAKRDCRCRVLNFIVKLCTSSYFPLSLHSIQALAVHFGTD